MAASHPGSVRPCWSRSLLAELVVRAALGAEAWPRRPSGNDSEAESGLTLFGPYLLGVELASILLLAGLVARPSAVTRAKTSRRSPGSRRGRERCRGP